MPPRVPDSPWSACSTPVRPAAPLAPGGKGFELRPSIERRRTPQWKRVVKHHGSIYAGTDLAAWLREQSVDTVTLVGFMVNNCVLASAAWGETIGLATEVLSDAVGAITRWLAVSRCLAATSSSPRWLRSDGGVVDREGGISSRPGASTPLVKKGSGCA